MSSSQYRQGLASSSATTTTTVPPVTTSPPGTGGFMNDFLIAHQQQQQPSPSGGAFQVVPPAPVQQAVKKPTSKRRRQQNPVTQQPVVNAVTTCSPIDNTVAGEPQTGGPSMVSENLVSSFDEQHQHQNQQQEQETQVVGASTTAPTSSSQEVLAMLLQTNYTSGNNLSELCALIENIDRYVHMFYTDIQTNLQSLVSDPKRLFSFYVDFLTERLIKNYGENFMLRDIELDRLQLFVPNIHFLVYLIRNTSLTMCPSSHTGTDGNRATEM